MPIQITDVRFNNEFRSSQDLNYLISCIGERVSVEVDFSYEDIIYATADNFIILGPESHLTNLADDTGIIFSEDQSAFADYKVGDTCVIVRDGFTTSEVTVIEVIDGSLIRTTHGALDFTLADDTDFIFNNTAFKGLTYKFNLTDGSTFVSLVDEEEQRAQIGTMSNATLSNQTLDLMGIKSWQADTVQVKGTGGILTDGFYEQQSFTITHNTVVTPFFLTDEHADLLIGKKPIYFEGDTNLNYIAEIAIGRDLTNPNDVKILTVPTNKSNTGWHNENFNGGPTNYVISSLTITRLSDSVVLNQLEQSTDCQVDIVITNTTDTPFSASNTKFAFGFNYLPEDESLYQENTFNQTRNFLFDSKLTTAGTGAVNGDNFGTPLQVIKTVEAISVTSSSMTVRAVINTGADANAIIEQLDLLRYKMWVIVEDHSTTAQLSDKVNLLAQVNEFLVVNITSNLITALPPKFIPHPETDKTGAILASAFTHFPVDDIVANLDFSIDFTGHLATELIKITNIKSRIYLSHATEADILLEDFSFGTSAFPIIGGQAQAIDFSQDRVFKIPDGEIRKTVRALREYTEDSGNVLAYNYKYPFMDRWEYWEALANITSAPTGIFDNTEPNNGLNHFWYRYTTVAGWEIHYDVTFTIEQNGETFTQVFDTRIFDPRNFEGNTDWSNHEIKSFTEPGGFELTSGPDKFIYGYSDIRIRVQAEKIFGPIPAVGDVVVVIWIETFEAGGIKDIRRISSLYDVGGDSWFKSVDASDKVVVTSPSSGVFRGEAILDHTKLPTNQCFTVYARFYDVTTPAPKQFQDGSAFLFQSGAQYQFQ